MEYEDDVTKKIIVLDFGILVRTQISDYEVHKSWLDSLDIEV